MAARIRSFVGAWVAEVALFLGFSTLGPVAWAEGNGIAGWKPAVRQTANDRASSCDLILLYTQNIQGFLQTCGCSGKKAVGLAELAAVVDRWREQYPGKVVFLDGGNIADRPDRGRTIWGILHEAGCAATSFGPAEARWAAGYWDLVSANPLPVAAFPLSTDPARGSDARRPYVICQVGEKQVGIVSMGPKFMLNEEDVQTLRSTLEKVRPQSDLTILISYRLLSEERTALSGDFAGLVDLVIGARGTEVLTQPERAGDGHILPTAAAGRELGMALVTLAGPDAERNLTVEYRAIRPGSGARAHPKVAQKIAEAAKEEQHAFLMEGLAGSADELRDLGYVDSAACKDCHEDAFTKWSDGRHSRALATLMAKDAVRPECLACHSEAFRWTGKVLSLDVEPQGVECATCHADPAAHLAQPEKGNIVRGSPEQCVGCHSATRDPDFDVQRRWADIAH